MQVHLISLKLLFYLEKSFLEGIFKTKQTIIIIVLLNKKIIKFLYRNRARKWSANDYYGFDSPNMKPLGNFDLNFEINWENVLIP